MAGPRATRVGVPEGTAVGQGGVATFGHREILRYVAAPLRWARRLRHGRRRSEKTAPL